MSEEVVINRGKVMTVKNLIVKSNRHKKQMTVGTKEGQIVDI